MYEMSATATDTRTHLGSSDSGPSVIYGNVCPGLGAGSIVPIVIFHSRKTEAEKNKQTDGEKTYKVDACVC